MIFIVNAGTLFRLPLRTSQQAESSLLSKRALSVDEARNLLEALRLEASAMLLFLKNIESIEICEWVQGRTEKNRIFSCNIMNITQELRGKRSFVGVLADKDKEDKNKKNSNVSTVDFSLVIDCEHSTGHARNEFNTVLDSLGYEMERETTRYDEKWEVCNQLGGESSNIIANNPLNTLLRLIPWGGVAVCTNPKPLLLNTTPSSSSDMIEFDHIESQIDKSNDDDKDKGEEDDIGRLKPGLAYCFLPLPILTGLPVMVNGFFELSSNRRDIWQSGQSGSMGGEMTGDGRTRAEWNLSLMRDVISPSYVRLLVRARDIMGFSDFFQGLFPSVVASPWSLIVDSTLARCRNEKLLYVTAPTSTDINSTDTMILKNQNDKGSMNRINSGNNDNNSTVGSWVLCSQAVLLPHTNMTSRDRQYPTVQSLSREQENKLSDFLLHVGQPLIRCTNELNKALQISKTCDIMATPSYVRTVLRTYSKKQTIEMMYKPSSSLCATFLLEYCISDLNPSAIRDCSELDSLPLLPLRGGGVGTINMLTPTNAANVEVLCGMGYSLSRSV